MNRVRAFARETFDLRRLTPGTLVHAARISVLAIGAWSIHGYLAGTIRDAEAGQVALALGLSALMAAPRRCGAELLGAVAIWLTTCEFMAASHTGQFALWRWSDALAALALVLVMTRVSHARALARANPWRPLRDSGQRQRTTGPGAAWGGRCHDDQVPASLADIEVRVRRVASGSSRRA